MGTGDFFRTLLDTMSDLRHPLAALATRMPWEAIEKALAPVLAHKDRAGRAVQGADLFGPSLSVVGAGVSHAGRPRLPVHLMVSLLYLKHAFKRATSPCNSSLPRQRASRLCATARPPVVSSAWSEFRRGDRLLLACLESPHGALDGAPPRTAGGTGSRGRRQGGLTDPRP